MEALTRFAELLSEDVAVVFSSISIHDLGFESQVMLIGLFRWKAAGQLILPLLASPSPELVVAAYFYPEFLVHVCSDIKASLST